MYWGFVAWRKYKSSLNEMRVRKALLQSGKSSKLLLSDKKGFVLSQSAEFKIPSEESIWDQRP